MQGWKKSLVILNCVAAIAFLLWWPYLDWVVRMDAPLRMTELDRAGVIDEGKLRQWRPDLAENLRRNLGLWVAEQDHRAALNATQAGLVVALLNIVFLVFLHCAQRRSPVTHEGGRRKMASE